jgi:hypothetical protein
MYNLLVSANDEAWGGETWETETGRCVREYTDADITKRFGELDATAVNALRRLPCIFAYETSCKKDPKFGILRDVRRRQDEVHIDYEIRDLSPFLSAADLSALAFDLDISKWELNRSHWAVKNVNLAKELRSREIVLPAWARNATKAVDIATHTFDVALSFPGEVRATVEKIAQELEHYIGPNSYFYDNNYVSQLARPSLDTLLQDIYRNRSRLIVVFIGGDYQAKDWCGIEFRAIKEIIMARDHSRIMFVKVDDGKVDGVFKTDGYIDLKKFAPDEIAHFIQQRVELLAEAD